MTEKPRLAAYGIVVFGEDAEDALRVFLTTSLIKDVTGYSVVPVPLFND